MRKQWERRQTRISRFARVAGVAFDGLVMELQVKVVRYKNNSCLRPSHLGYSPIYSKN